MAFPTSLDNLATNKSNSTTQTTDHPNHHNSLADAVNNIETTIGTTGSPAMPRLGAANTFTAFPQTVGSGDKFHFGNTVTPTRFDTREGTAASPVTALANSVRISKTTALTRATFVAAGGGGQTTDDDAALAGTAKGLAAGEVQAVGLAGYATHAGTGTGGSGGGPDALGVWGVGVINTSGAVGRALGGYFMGRNTLSGGQLSGLEVQAQNQTGADGTYSPSGANATVGILLSAGASGTNNRSACGFRINGNSSATFDVGFGVGSEGPVVSSTFRDDGTATQSLHILGTHTTGLRIDSATITTGINVVTCSGTAINVANTAGPLAMNSNYIHMAELSSAPAAPAANAVRLYAIDNGSGQTQLMALFSSGASQQIAIQP